MLTPHSLGASVLSLCFAALPHVVRSQTTFSTPYTITNISMLTAGITTVDLYDFYEGDGFDSLAGIGYCWKFRKADGNELTFAFSTANSTVELISGTSANAGNDTIDILGADVGPDNTCVTYWPPSTLPLGAYHLRISATVNTTVGSDTTIQTPTARGADFNITRTQPLGCGSGREPGTFDKITSPTAPNYSILFFVAPHGGQNVRVDDAGAGKVPVNGGYKDGSNGKGISNVKVQFIDNASGSDVGGAQDLTLSESVEFGGGYNIKDIGLQVNGSYKVKLTYNTATGAQQSVTSEEFNIVTKDTNCTALSLNDSDGSNGGQSGGDSNSGSSSGDSKPPGSAMGFAQLSTFNMMGAFAVILFGLLL